MKGVSLMNVSNAEFQRMMEKYKREMEQYIRSRPVAAQTQMSQTEPPRTEPSRAQTTQTERETMPNPAAEEREMEVIPTAEERVAETAPTAEETPESAPVPRSDIEQSPSPEMPPMTPRAQRTAPEAGYVTPPVQPEGSEELAQQDSQPDMSVLFGERTNEEQGEEPERGETAVPEFREQTAPPAQRLRTEYTDDELRNQMPPIMRPDSSANPEPTAPAEIPLERPRAVPQYIPAETPDGLMQVRTLTARGAIPVPDVAVTVTDPSGRLMFSGVTDLSGSTQVFSLPTVSRALSEEEGNPRPFSTYNVKAVRSGFFPATSVNVAVFEGVTAVVPFDMIPLPNGESGRMLEFQNTEPNL